jgi:hypothetical protein
MTTVFVLLAAFSLAAFEQSPPRATFAQKRAAMEPDVLITTLPEAELKTLTSEKAMEHDSEVARTEVVSVVVSMPKCQKDANGMCNASADVVVSNPDGSKHSDLQISLPSGRGTATLRLAPYDVTGVYTVVATVRDLRASRFGTAERKFGVK